MKIQKKVLETNMNLLDSLSRSEAWIILQLDKEGLQVRFSHPVHSLLLISSLLAEDEEAWDIVKKEVWKIKKIKTPHE